jgi:hypothetical protein
MLSRQVIDATYEMALARRLLKLLHSRTGDCSTDRRLAPRRGACRCGAEPANQTKEKTMSITMREVICAAALGVFALSSHAMGNDTKSADKAQYKSAVASAEAEYKSAKSACNAKTGNDKDVCVKEAKANLEKAKQDAKANRKSKDAMATAQHEKMEANYSVAKEKCDAMSGDAKSKCVQEAKARYHQ